jgi:hypothetical protein
MRSLINHAVAGALLMAPLSLSAPARAGDIQGDAYSCAELWVMRNQIYKNAGYCFKTAKAIKYFGNAGCRFDDEDDVPLSKNQRRIISDIEKSQIRQGC